jgi:hypothetical protein
MEFVLLLLALTIAYQLFVPRSVFREVHADIRRRRQSSRDVEEKLAQLHHLTPPEREILRVYVLQPTYVRVQDPQDAVVRSLIQRGILRPVPDSSKDAEGAAFSIAAWTRSYLVSRPELLR